MLRLTLYTQFKVLSYLDTNVYVRVHFAEQTKPLHK